MRNLHFQYYFQKEDLVIPQNNKSNCYQLDTLMPDCYITAEDLQRIQNIFSLLSSLSKKKKVSDNINIALKKVHGIIILSL